MNFKQRISASYIVASPWSKREQASYYQRPFVMTPDVEAFLEEHDELKSAVTEEEVAYESLDDDQQADADDNGSPVKLGRLDSEKAEELAKSFKIFIDGKPLDSYTDSWEKGVEDEFNKKILLPVLQSLKVDAKTFDFTVSARLKEEHGHTGGYVDLSADGEQLTLEPEGMYYGSDKSSLMNDSWDWLTWLGTPESPFFYDTWGEMYVDTEVAHWFEQVFEGFTDEDELKKSVEKWVKELLDEKGIPHD